ncbi:MAG: dienelactone hydrolase family protein [Thermoplasmata archaeon]
MTAAPDRPIPGHQRTLDGFLATPAAGVTPKGGVIVVHEIFGLDDHHRDVARRFAAAGYVAVAPNLFTGELAAILTPDKVQRTMAAMHSAPPDLRRDPSKFREFAATQPPEIVPVMEAFGRVTSPPALDGFAQDLREVRKVLVGQPGVDPRRTAAVGFCFGGTVVGRFATVEPELRAGVIFYGQNPPLERVPAIRAALLGLYGSEDPGITGTVPDLEAAMRAAGKHFEHHVYPGAKHAFFNDQRPNYHEASARDAWNRVLDFFGRELR